MAALLLSSGALSAMAQKKPSTTGTLTVDLQNVAGLEILLESDPSGVTLTNSGTASATAGFGNVSEYGTLEGLISRTIQSTTFTVSTPFDVYVVKSGLSDSSDYTLTASLTAAAPIGVSYQIDSGALTTSSKTVSATGSYATDEKHTLSLVVSTAASGSGGPKTGTQLSSTINLVATAN